MTRTVFVDTGASVALADTDDQYHSIAVGAYAPLLRQVDSLVTTNLVIAESYTLIRRRLGHRPGIRFLETLRTTQRLIKVYSDSVLEADAEATLRHYADQSFSFTDAVSFAVVRKRKNH
jgi:uncharacterized protein